jgi:hypothetical protein
VTRHVQDHERHEAEKLNKEFRELGINMHTLNLTNFKSCTGGNNSRRGCGAEIAIYKRIVY